ncbi:LOW QUALITY PROTEIN: hypothetical protein TorRG33x02_256760 [Trema orientale]|uniref:Uncharacterized protein n=1 Tax=Trema orientale TaxID=63057 RepID=A0A2P5DB74_TREOI|nr:LOW QUALITY PROTEIN: hypothetical protein TorRG33x02_256760 [Trema orientale]
MPLLLTTNVTAKIQLKNRSCLLIIYNCRNHQAYTKVTCSIYLSHRKSFIISSQVTMRKMEPTSCSQNSKEYQQTLEYHPSVLQVIDTCIKFEHFHLGPPPQIHPS